MQKLLFLEVPTPLHTKHLKCTVSHIKCNLNIAIPQWGGSGVADSISASVHICRDCFLLQVIEHNLNYFKGNEILLAHITVR